MSMFATKPPVQPLDASNDDAKAKAQAAQATASRGASPDSAAKGAASSLAEGGGGSRAPMNFVASLQSLFSGPSRSATMRSPAPSNTTASVVQDGASHSPSHSHAGASPMAQDQEQVSTASAATKKRKIENALVPVDPTRSALQPRLLDLPGAAPADAPSSSTDATGQVPQRELEDARARFASFRDDANALQKAARKLVLSSAEAMLNVQVQLATTENALLLAAGPHVVERLEALDEILKSAENRCAEADRRLWP